ncbi:hypothetical protein RGQ15_14890 [Paracoccus sp. MBLB3053]|uniref:Uncharacterized protein n=1 Tax=Paracoccus aurantius TaxID=3073814 RepID=A0ABU2HUX2_9RHOB|nr:hypothetical protein [Paracoccus sp. MBLB3053]MDS9468850.1 hypothetical protein [Paracoccus sp. MBLB3053]
MLHDKQHLPDQPGQDGDTYPSGMERERQLPEGGPEKPKPSPDYRPEDDASTPKRSST